MLAPSLRLAALLLLLFAQKMAAQQPFTQPVFPIRVEKNIVYGTATNFAGQPETLRLDLFKPVGDGQTRRPIFVYVHGGAWLESSVKDTGADSLICAEMARRGYVVANVEYRRGYHRLHNYTPYALCNSNLGLNTCIYAYDTSEILRAVFRGMQDVRGAIRFLKNRHAQDSTDVARVTIGGSSAGGFIALAVGYMDCSAEKSAACGALPAVEAAHPSFVACNPPGALSLSRPDLGDLAGALHLGGGHDASVVGVANFFGGVFQNLFAGQGKLPALYAFHQTNDVVVDCGTKPPYASFFEQVIYPLNLCQPIYSLPPAAGSCSICAFLEASGLPQSVFDCQILQNGLPFALANPPGHAFDNIPARVQQVADFFSPFLTGQKTLAAAPPCLLPAAEPLENQSFASLAPTVFGSDGCVLRFQLPQAASVRWAVADLRGRVLLAQTERLPAGETQRVLAANFPPGAYVVFAQTEARAWQCLVFSVE